MLHLKISKVNFCTFSGFLEIVVLNNVSLNALFSLRFLYFGTK